MVDLNKVFVIVVTLLFCCYVCFRLGRATVFAQLQRDVDREKIPLEGKASATMKIRIFFDDWVVTDVIQVIPGTTVTRIIERTNCDT